MLRNLKVLLLTLGICCVFGNVNFLYSEDLPFVQLAWEHPGEDAEAYPITGWFFWNPPKDMFAIGFRYLTVRTSDNADEDTLGLGLTFRPLLFNFGNSVVLSAGAYLSGSLAWADSTRHEPDSGAYADGLIETDTDNYSTGLSLMLSWPKAQIQCALDIGHYWSRAEAQTKYCTIGRLLPEPLPPIEFVPRRDLQKERGLEYCLEVSYLHIPTADMLYLYGITLDFYGSTPTGPRSTDIRVKYPELGEHQHFGFAPVETGFFLALAYLRFRLFEVDPSSIVESWKGIQRLTVTLEPTFGIGYFRENHGHCLVLGVRLNIFEVLGISWNYVWERNNEADDSMIFNLEAGFRFGHKLGGRVKG